MNWPKANRNGSATTGFTRTDLMACVVVSVVLTALAASGLSGSKDNTSRIICASNLRQMALAEAMYAADNRDYFAFCNWDGGSAAQEGPNNPGWLYQAGSSGIPSPFAAQFTNSPQSAWATGAWWHYVQNPNAYLCPVDIQSPSYARHTRNNMLSSYVMNGAVVGFGASGMDPPWQMARVSQVWSPACYLMWEPGENTLGPGNPGAFEFNDGANYPSTPPAGAEGLGLLHGNNGGEIVAVGGNVGFVTAAAFQAQGNGTGTTPNLAWWSPFSANGH